MNTQKTITLIGSGNVSTHLGKSLLNKGFFINEVYSKTLKNATTLAKKLNCSATNSLQNLKTDSDIYIICIKDDFITAIIEKLPKNNAIIAHTSGSVSMRTLNHFDNHGIFYPLQTFSKEKKVNMYEVPFCIEANNKETKDCLFYLAKTISNSVYTINSEQRKIVHLAAVFACNFSNYMYTMSEDILNQNNIDFNILKPLIVETAKKIQHNSAKSMQTGPAKRKDDATIKNHIKMLEKSKEYQEIYKLITQRIINQ